MTPVEAGVMHADVLAAIHAAAFPPAERWDAAAFAAQLEVPGTFALLVAAGGFVLIRVAADQAEVLTLAVMPAERRRGAARALLRAAEAGAGFRGATAMFLEVAEGNMAGRALYEDAGYEPVGRRRTYYPGGGDALVLRHTLPGPEAADTPADRAAHAIRPGPA